MKLFADKFFLDRPSMRNGQATQATVLALTLAGGCLLGAGQVQAQTSIDYYNFNNGQSSGTALSTPVTHATNSGGGSGPTNSAITTNFPTSSTNFEVLAGSTLNAQNGDGAGNALAVLGGTGATGAGTGGNNGDYIQLQTSSAGYNGLALSFATEGSSTGFTSNQLSYSTNNSTFTNFGNPYTPSLSSGTNPPGYMTQSFNLSSVNALDNQANVYLRITFSGASGSTGSNRIDNLTLTGNAVTPAPPGVVSAGIGFGVTGLSALIRRRRQSMSIKNAEAAA